MAAGLRCGLCYAVGLCLKRPCGVDDEINVEGPELLCQVGGFVVQRHTLRVMTYGVSQRLGFAGIAASDQQVDLRVPRQCFADAGAKVAVAAQYQYVHRGQSGAPGQVGKGE